MALDTFRNSGGIDRGPVLIFACPHCDEPHPLHLIENRSSSALLAWLRIGTAWRLRCAGCAFELEVEEHDLAGLRAIRHYTRQFSDGAIDRETYLGYLVNSRLSIVDELLRRNETWECPQCHEQVPVTFHQCWVCNTPWPDAPPPPPDAEDTPPEPPTLFVTDALGGTQAISNPKAHQPPPPRDDESR